MKTKGITKFIENDNGDLMVVAEIIDGDLVVTVLDRAMPVRVYREGDDWPEYDSENTDG